MTQIDTIRNLDENDRDLLKANLLISYGLYHRAAGILKRQLQKSPEDKGIKDLLIGLFKKNEKYRGSCEISVSLPHQRIRGVSLKGDYCLNSRHLIYKRENPS